MGRLIAYGKEVESVFQLMGTLENDITKSIAWAFSQCPLFTKILFDRLLNIDCNPDLFLIRYQLSEKDKGITDLEITDGELFYVIIEAKRGWVLPTKEQLSKYSIRTKINNGSIANRAIITLSECSEEYADTYQEIKEINGLVVKHISWKTIWMTAVEAKTKSNTNQKRILEELIVYLGGIMTTQNKDSNWVYVVSLSYDSAGGSKLSYVDIVNKKEKYYHPYGINGWPKETPNYIAFRYNGQLQSIHHIESDVKTKNLHTAIPEMPDEECSEQYVVYSLGPAIKPNKTVKTGKIYASGRKWAMLDLLLTSDTIAEACDKSYERQNE